MTSSETASAEFRPEDDRRASRRRPSRVATVALAIVAVLQVIGTVYTRAHTNGPAPFVQAGHDLSDLSFTDPRGTLQPLGAGPPTLLLVFDPACVHSRSVATLWSDWLEENVDRGYQIVAISTDPKAMDYVRERQWPVIVTSAEPVGHAITKRTPWVFAVDAQGRVVADGHGRHFAEVAQNLRSAGDA